MGKGEDEKETGRAEAEDNAKRGSEYAGNDYTKTRKSLKYSIIDGSMYSVMQGFGSTYLAPFALAMKASNTIIGALATVPELVGSFFQLSSTYLLEKFRSRKRIIVFLAFLQAFLWLPLLLIPFFAKSQGPVILLIFITFFGILSFVINPLWTSLMGDLVPEDERGRYFGKRNTIISIVFFLSTFAAGYILSIFESRNVFVGFSILFVVAFISRLFSAFYFSKMYEPVYVVDKKASFSFWEFIVRMKRSDNYYGKFVIYLCVLGFAANIAGPFFTVYMLKDLKFNYLTFTIVSMSSIVASFLSMSFWGRINDSRGSKFVLFITGFLISFVPLLWLLTKNPVMLFVIEIYSGVVWGGFNLASSNFIFDATTPQKRTRCITYFNLMHGICIFAGALLGGWLSAVLPYGSFTSAIPVLFIISGALRFLSALIFLPMLKEMRLVEIPVGHSLFSSITIKPRQGVHFEPIGTYEKKKTESKPLNKQKKPASKKLAITPKEKEMILKKEKEELIKSVESVESKAKKK